MSRTLSDQIAHDHQPAQVNGAYQCSCGEKAPFRYFDKYGDLNEWHRAHTNAVTEAAVREQVARDILATLNRPHWWSDLEQVAYESAARIARGGAA